MLLFIFLILLFAAMAAMSFILLHRYATEGREVSANTAKQSFANDQKMRETDSKEEAENSKDTEDFLKKLAPGRTIRVQILGDDYLTDNHKTLAVTAPQEMHIRCGKEERTVPSGSLLRILWSPKNGSGENVSDDIFRESSSGDPARSVTAVLSKDMSLTVKPAEKDQALTLPELKRGQPNPSYAGKLCIYGSGDGLTVINEVDLETYLQSVVSSEMPSSYPMQALCAQAICARTYAVNCMELAREQKKIADLDDSVAYQVYNNYPGDDLSAQAVAMTLGLVMNRSGVYYYSTSCLTENRTDLDSEENFRKFLDNPPPGDAEYGSPWIRWSVRISRQHILDNLKELYGCSWKELHRAEVLERKPDGQVQSVIFSSGSEELFVEGEYQIRRAFGCTGLKLLLNDGSEAENPGFLPSAYFYIQECAGMPKKNAKTDADSILICGGGYGHGIGMSQNGAAAMAQNGAGYEEILNYYY